MAVGKRKESYEESRRKRLEENRKRMEALNLPKLALDLRISPSKPSPVSLPLSLYLYYVSNSIKEAHSASQLLTTGEKREEAAYNRETSGCG